MSGAKWKVTRDGATLAECDTELDAVQWMHWHGSSFSIAWAVQWEGFDIVAPSGAKWSEGASK
jgi:hypothetical protein